MSRRFDELYEQLVTEMVYSVDDIKNNDVFYTAPEENSMQIMHIIAALEKNPNYADQASRISRDARNFEEAKIEFGKLFQTMKKEVPHLNEIPEQVWNSLTNYAFSRIAGDDVKDAVLPAWEGTDKRIVDAFDTRMKRRLNSPEKEQILPFAAYINNYVGAAGGSGLNSLFKSEDPDMQEEPPKEPPADKNNPPQQPPQQPPPKK